MAYVSPDQVAQAREMDLLTYLQLYEPDNLVRFSGETYCTREHDSLKISNGKWNWFSRGIGGRTALDYLIKVRDYTFPQAVELLSGGAALRPPSFHAPKPEPPKVFTLPERNANSDRVRRYLWNRGISKDVLDYCIGKGLLYESRQHHNAVFVGYDQDGKARYAALRGTWGNFKGEVSASDKRYSFSIPAQGESSELHLFESAIDLLSYCTLCQLFGRNWQKEQLLSLGGVAKNRTEKTLPVALEQFLSGHPETKTVFLHLDNDEAGRKATLDITEKLQGPYKVLDAAPSKGKDVNDLLRLRLGLTERKEERGR